MTHKGSSSVRPGAAESEANISLLVGAHLQISTWAPAGEQSLFLISMSNHNSHTPAATQRTGISSGAC